MALSMVFWVVSPLAHADDGRQVGASPGNGQLAQPEELTATPGPGRLNLQWTEPPDVDDDQRYSLSIDGGPVEGDTLLQVDGAEATIEGLVGGLEYTVEVRTGVGQDRSAPVFVDATPDAGPPWAPEGMSAEETPTRDLLVEWAEPFADGGSPVTDFKVAARSDGGTDVIETFAINDVSVGSGAFEASLDVAAGATYDVTVAALNSVGTGRETEPERVEMRPPPGAPHAVGELGVAVVGLTAQASWTAPESDGGAALDRYEVTVDPVPASLAGEGGVLTVEAGEADEDGHVEVTVEGLMPARETTFEVVAINGEGLSSATEEVAVTSGPASTTYFPAFDAEGAKPDPRPDVNDAVRGQAIDGVGQRVAVVDGPHGNSEPSDEARVRIIDQVTGTVVEMTPAAGGAPPEAEQPFAAPALSDDGSRVAFLDVPVDVAEGGDEVGTVWFADLPADLSAGVEQAQQVPGGLVEAGPLSLSADGSRLATAGRIADDGPVFVVVVDLDSGLTATIDAGFDGFDDVAADGTFGPPRLSGDGETVVFATNHPLGEAPSEREATEVYAVDVSDLGEPGDPVWVSAGEADRALDGDSSMPDVDFDGQTVVFRSTARDFPRVDGAAVLRAVFDGAAGDATRDHLQPVSETVGGDAVVAAPPSVSADGDVVVFGFWRWTADADGAHPFNRDADGQPWAWESATENLAAEGRVEVAADGSAALFTLERNSITQDDVAKIVDDPGSEEDASDDVYLTVFADDVAGADALAVGPDVATGDIEVEPGVTSATLQVIGDAAEEVVRIVAFVDDTRVGRAAGNSVVLAPLAAGDTTEIDLKVIDRFGSVSSLAVGAAVPALDEPVLALRPHTRGVAVTWGTPDGQLGTWKLTAVELDEAGDPVGDEWTVADAEPVGGPPIVDRGAGDALSDDTGFRYTLTVADAAGGPSVSTSAEVATLPSGNGVTTTLTSLTTDGNTPEDGLSTTPSVSADGSVVAYVTYDEDIVGLPNPVTGPAPNRGPSQVVVDRGDGPVVLSLLSDGTRASIGSDDPVVSSDGNTVVFRTSSPGLASTLTGTDVEDIPNASSNIIRADWTGTTWQRSLVSQDLLGQPSPRRVGPPDVTADGSLVVFRGSSELLLENNPLEDVSRFFKEVVVAVPTDGPAQIVSPPASGDLTDFRSSEPVAGSSPPAVAGDGSLVVFEGRDPALLPEGDWPDEARTDDTRVIAMPLDTSGDGALATPGEAVLLYDDALVADGSLVAAGSEGPPDVEIRQAGAPSVTDDGRRVVFRTASAVPTSSNADGAVWIADLDDLSSPQLWRAAVSVDGSYALRARDAQITGDGAYLLWRSPDSATSADMPFEGTGGTFTAGVYRQRLDDGLPAADEPLAATDTRLISMASDGTSNTFVRGFASRDGRTTVISTGETDWVAGTPEAAPQQPQAILERIWRVNLAEEGQPATEPGPGPGTDDGTSELEAPVPPVRTPAPDPEVPVEAVEPEVPEGTTVERERGTAGAIVDGVEVESSVSAPEVAPSDPDVPPSEEEVEQRRTVTRQFVDEVLAAVPEDERGVSVVDTDDGAAIVGLLADRGDATQSRPVPPTAVAAVSAGDVRLLAAVTDRRGNPRDRAEDGALRGAPGGDAAVRMFGLPADTEGQIQVRSTARVLGVVSTDGAGRLASQVELPGDLPPGDHTLVITVGGTTTSIGISVEADFDDVSTGNVHVDAIEALAEDGVFQGRADGTFGPARGLLRGQMATVLARLLNLDIDEDAAVPFVDVADDATHAGAIAAIADEGFTEGCDNDGRFCPDTVVTRGQLAAFLARAYDLPEVDVDPFTDIATVMLADEIRAAAAAGVIDGFGDGTFRPDEPVTRAQAASMLFSAREAAEE